ncbi:MAG: hypothetical protein HUK22_05055, partial [Thermoguttaceae bacterium]|nr:hypothetical protein [Thermoguttaceae bacterium]
MLTGFIIAQSDVNATVENSPFCGWDVVALIAMGVPCLSVFGVGIGGGGVLPDDGGTDVPPEPDEPETPVEPETP